MYQTHELARLDDSKPIESGGPIFACDLRGDTEGIMAGQLDGKRIAFLVTDGFEQSELADPRATLEREGATCEVVSPKEQMVQGWSHGNWADEIPVDVPLSSANPDDYDTLVLPGGVINPDALRTNPEALAFVKRFFVSGKPVAAICHGPWTLIDAGVVSGRRMTSWPSLKTDLVNAGAEWIDAEVVVDNGLVTSRKPEDIPAFSAKVIEETLEGLHGEPRRQRAAARSAAGSGW